jgi:hypothetical protein
MNGKVVVNRMYKKRGGFQREEEGIDEIAVGKFPEGVPITYAEYSNGNTLNMGDFESIRVDVGVKLPCYLEELPDAYLTAVQFVEEKLAIEVRQIIALRNDNVGDL